MGILDDLAVPGTRITVRVQPRASRNAVTRDGDQIRVYTTAPPADGAANAAVARLLATELGIARSRLRLLRGTSARTKTFGID